MASWVARFVAKKILGETAQNKFGVEDPYFENVPATKLNGRPERVRRQRKAAPPGLSEHDVEVLTKVKRRAYRLDCKFSICGFRWGLSSLIGIIPLIGDALDILLAVMVVRTCCQVEDGLPAALQLKMYTTVFMDFLVGLVPFLGDIGDAAYKANTINAARLEEHLRAKGKKTLRNSNMPVPAVDPSDPDQFDQFQQQGPADISADPDHDLQRQRRQQATRPAPPETEAQSAGWGSLFGLGRARQPASDAETGRPRPQNQQRP